jgi:pyruvate/2-oxoglutarate dehydrogenase complex dihydrolipoamide dehydrogenase (E3) component
MLVGEAPKVDFAAVMERMRRLRSEISSHDSARRFRDDLGVDVYFGDATFVESDCVAVNGTRLFFHRAAICSGARAASLPIPGLVESGYLTNESVFELTELPPRLAVIGGGPIGCELAQAFARFGSRVTLIEQASQILGREDRDAAEILHQVFVQDGIDLQLGVKIAAIERQGNERLIHLEIAGHALKVIVDQILVGVGRAPNVSGLNLEKAGITYDQHNGIAVDETMQTTNPRIYAAGDVCSPFKFTHTADAQARIVIANALFKGRQKSTALTIPWCTYTDPEIAHVGMYEQEAVGKGLEVTTLTITLSDVDRAVLDGETDGFARVHLKKGSDRILGATVVARHAGEMINELSLAITSGLGLSAIGRTIHPYPTQAEVIRKLADAYNRTRLTPFVKKVLAAWLKWQRSGR